jgi:preprotein translocase subunit YajC
MFFKKPFFGSTVPLILLLLNTPLWAQDGGGQQQPGFGGLLVPLVLTILIIYFLMIRPQQKKLKQHQQLLEQLKPGEEVLTNAGIYGKIHQLHDQTVILEIANNVRVKFLKSQIAGPAKETQAASGQTQGINNPSSN